MVPAQTRKLAVLWLLVLTTALWGTTVAAHQHVGDDHGLCEISLLPHAGQVAPAADPVPLAFGLSTVTATVVDDQTPVFSPLYRSRAPPA